MTPILTTTLNRHGASLTVLARPDGDRLSAIGYANPRQAERRAAALKASGVACWVNTMQRPYYVVLERGGSVTKCPECGALCNVLAATMFACPKCSRIATVDGHLVTA